jgi:dolichol-phosphate mannosyltransferase
VLSLIIALQLAALGLLLVRLAPGYRRRPPVAPLPEGRSDTSVSVLVATLNEAARLGPCLASLRRDGAPLSEIIVIDSTSSDGTRELIAAAATNDGRIRLETDPPLPDDWVGKVWALQHGLSVATGEWVLGMDADTEARRGLVAAAVAAAEAVGADVVSFSPRFEGQSTAEQWLQPSILLSLIYRSGALGGNDAPERVLANGQCFLSRRRVLLAHGGYTSARASFSDDVTLARHLARAGVKVGFLDGTRLYSVRSYASAASMWREWGRSIALADATSRRRQSLDVAFIALVQGFPLPVLAWALIKAGTPAALPDSLIAINVALLFIRVLMSFAIAGSYGRHSVGYWLSPLSDPLAALRLVWSTVRRARTWRGRTYAAPTAG